MVGYQWISMLGLSIPNLRPWKSVVLGEDLGDGWLKAFCSVGFWRSWTMGDVVSDVASLPCTEARVFTCRLHWISLD